MVKRSVDRFERRWIAVAIVVSGLLLGLSAATALGPIAHEKDGIGLLAHWGDAFYARIDPRGDDRLTRWVRSDDGVSWTVVERKDMPRAIPGWNKVSAYCANDGWCYRINDEGYDVERGNDRQGWVVEIRSATQLSYVAVNPQNSGQALVIADRKAILVRGRDVTWSAANVIAATAPPVWEDSLQRLLGSQLSLVVIGVALCLIGGWRYGRVGDARGIWVTANVVTMCGLVYARPTPDGLEWALIAWLAVGVTILALPLPRRRAAPPEPGLR